MSLTLRPYQHPHVSRCKEILQTLPCVLDTSVMGSGKSYTTAALALELAFPHMIVICPPTLESKWAHMRDSYSLPISTIVSFQSLRTRPFHQPSCGLLRRVDLSGDVRFEPLPRFTDLVAAGLLLVIDECQNIKNHSIQHRACKALTSYITMSKTTSRFILLSGSPFDKEEHVVNVLQLAGFIQTRRLYRLQRDIEAPMLVGAQELVDYCTTFNPEATERIRRTYGSHRDTIERLCYTLFTEVLKPVMVTCMPPPNVEVKIDCRDGYYNIDAESIGVLIEGINLLHNSSSYDVEDESVDTRRLNWVGINRALAVIERGKIRTVGRLVREALTANPLAKAAVFVFFRESIERLRSDLEEYHPLVLDGTVPKDSRPEIIDAFQAEDDRHRVILCNLIVGSTGIDLDDKAGNRPRHGFFMSNYQIEKLHQAVYRFYRTNTRSTPVLRFVYGKCGKRELSILKALARKARVLRETLDVQVENGVVFPGEYEEYIEPGDQEEVIEDLDLTGGKSCRGQVDDVEVKEAPKTPPPVEKPKTLTPLRRRSPESGSPASGTPPRAGGKERDHSGTQRLSRMIQEMVGLGE